MKKITTIKELKELLNQFDENSFINFGVERLGFEIDSYESDGVSLALMSSQLQDYLDENDMS